MPVIVNSKLKEDLSYISQVSYFKKNDMFMPLSDIRKKEINYVEQDIFSKVKHAQVLQELLLVLAICNTVVVSKHPHHDVVSFVSLFKIINL